MSGNVLMKGMAVKKGYLEVAGFAAGVLVGSFSWHRLGRLKSGPGVPIGKPPANTLNLYAGSIYKPSRSKASSSKRAEPSLRPLVRLRRRVVYRPGAVKLISLRAA
jgi:hypothetical protein